MFVQVVEGQCPAPEALRTEWDRWAREVAPAGVGWLGSTAGVSADGRFVAVTRFESEEAARMTADRPEQSAWAGRLAEQLTGPAVIRDCPEVRAFLRGSWDDASLVRIEQGQARAIDRVVSNFEARAASRPGPGEAPVAGILAWGPDWYVTEALYYTASAGARHATAADRVADPLLRDAASLVEARTGVDLTSPWSALPAAP